MNLKFLLKVSVTILLIVLNSCGTRVKSAEKELGDLKYLSLRVMSYNIHHASPASKPGCIDIEAIVRVIKAENPDLVALQEVDADTERSGEGNQAEMIAEKLDMFVYFAKALDYTGGEYGNAILSKYPLRDGNTHVLPNAPEANTETRVWATAKIEIPNGSELVFGSTHLDYKKDSPSRLFQIGKIIEVSEKEELPMIVAGDFNATPDSETIKLLDKEFTRTCQKTCAPTIPVKNPERAIDFIAYRHPQNKFSVEYHEVINEPYASDHLPVFSVIKIRE